MSEDIRPYRKHQLYCGPYQVEPGGVVQLPEDCEWKVLRYQGEKNFSRASSGGGPIALLLDDVEKQFWSVISFLSQEEAKKLRDSLDKALEEKE